MHPNQFQVNEAWIFFKLNDAPILTESDGDFNFIALMDAASCFILSSAAVSATLAEPPGRQTKQLLEQAQAHKQQWPNTLFIAIGQPANFLVAEAERQGITVVRAPADQLLPFIGEAREDFRERLGGGTIQ